MEVRGRTCKRIVFADSHVAARVARALSAFAPSGICPGILLLRDRDLWLEWIEGDPLCDLTPLSPASLDGVARILAELNRRAPHALALAGSEYAHQLRLDLDFLRDVGSLGPVQHAGLVERMQAWAPRRVWIGWDCTDAILKNFVREPGGRVVLVDAETLGEQQLVGLGFAKASLRWLGDDRDAFLARLAELGAPDLRDQARWLELCFAAFWVKSSLLAQKRRYSDPRLFERFLALEVGPQR